MLKVDSLSKNYGKVKANDNLNFNVPSGTISVLIGPNGAGKSTAIKAIAGLLRFSGTILIDGHPNKSVEAKRKLGYVPELPAAYDLLTVKEHMEFIARAYSLTDWEDYSDALLRRFEMQDNLNKLGKELSKGMQQKLSLCCALLPRPRLLLVDEPMVGLDPYAIKELKALFLEEKQKGTAVLISTHLLDSVEELWDRALIMSKGRIVAERGRYELEASGESLDELFFSATGNGQNGESA